MENSFLNLWPAWLAVALALIAAVHQLVVSSEKIANLLGRWGRWVYRRSRKRYLLDVEEFNNTLTQAVAEAREQWEAEEARALSVVEQRLEYMTELVAKQQEELTTLNFGHRCTLAYIEYEADWHHRLQMLIVSIGRTLSVNAIPDHIPYYEFERLCQQSGNTQWRRWIGQKQS